MVNSIRLLVPLLAVVVAACVSPAASPTAQPQAPVAGATQPAGPSPAAKPTPATGTAPTTAPAAKPTSKPTPASLNFGYPAVAATYWHLYVAGEKGLYADEALDVKATYVQAGASAIAQGVVAGAYQLGSITGDIGAIAIHNGADIAYIASEIHLPIFHIIAQPEIKSYADIKNNAKVGSAAVRGASATLLRALFIANGLREGSDYTMLAAGSTGERVGALRNRSIDAALMAQPQGFMLQDEGYTVLGLTSDSIKDYAFNEIAARRDWAKGNEDVLVRFIRAHTRAIDWLYDPKNKEESIRILMKATNVDDKYARKTYELFVEQLKAFVPKGEPSEKAFDGAIKLTIDANELDRATTVTGAKMIDKSYWQKAQDSLKNR